MIYHIEDLDQRLFTAFFGDAQMVDMANEFHNIITGHTNQLRGEVAHGRIARAVDASDNRKEAINIAFDEAIKYTDDKQNVHDSKVNHDLRTTLQTLRAQAAPGLSSDICIDEAHKFIGKIDDQNKADLAARVLEQIKKKEYISTFNMREDMIFAYVWDRSNHPENAENGDLIREAIINSLADSVENGALVCINGRCSRMINSLATLDFDSSMGAALTFEAYRNQIFQEVKEIVNQAIDNGKNSSDDAVRDIASKFELGD